MWDISTQDFGFKLYTMCFFTNNLESEVKFWSLRKELEESVGTLGRCTLKMVQAETAQTRHV